MAAFPTARAHAHLPGQGSVEFILIMPVLLTFLFAIGSFAMLSYQNTVIQHSLATLADALPAGWQEQDRNELVRDLVCDGTDLDKSRLTVTNARVKTETSGAVNDGDSIASDLGGLDAQDRDAPRHRRGRYRLRVQRPALARAQDNPHAPRLAQLYDLYGLGGAVMTSRKPLRTRGLPGQVAVIFVVAISCLLIAVGLGVDVSTAYSAKTGQEAVLEAVRQSSLGMSNAVKYSENPGREAREEVVELLSDNGYTGTAEIRYAELPESESGSNDRYAGVYVRLSNDTETTFLKLAGRDKLTARSTAVWTIHPYSTGNVYRPADVGNGSLEATFEDGTVTGRKETATRLADAPGALLDAVRGAAAAKGNPGSGESGD